MLLQQILNGIITGSIYGAVALGLTLIFGILKVPNFAHGATYMMGAYLTYWTIQYLNISLPTAILITTIFITAIGFAVEKLLFKPIRDRDTIDAFIVALGLLIIMENLALYLWGPETRIIDARGWNQVLVFHDLTITSNRLIIFLSSTALIILISYFVSNTKLGTAMQAVAEDKEASALVGISPNKVMGITFAVSSGLAAAAGGLVGSSFSIFPTMGDMVVLKAFCAIVLGGMGSVMGAIIASFTLGLAESLGSAYINSSFKDAFAFLILIAVLIFRPHGILGKEGEE